MTEISPVFDPRTGTWFLVDRDEEAPTIRELLAKLGNGTTVTDYYPFGHQVERAEPAAVAIRVPPVPLSPKKRIISKARRYDHDKVLDLWSQGEVSASIAKELGMARGGVTRLVSQYRKSGDPRAVSRYKGLYNGR